MVKWIICLEIGTFLAAGSCKQFGWDLSVFTSMRKFQWLMGRNFRAHWWRISGNHNICQPLKVSHKRTNSMDTERYMLKLLGWGVWEWVRSTCCIIFTSSETGEKSKSNSREREREKLTTAERPGKLLIGWSARARWKWLQRRRQPDLRLDRHRAPKPAGYTIHTPI